MKKHDSLYIGTVRGGDLEIVKNTLQEREIVWMELDGGRE